MVTNEQKEILQKQKAEDFYMAAGPSSCLCQSLTCLFTYITKEFALDAEKGSMGRQRAYLG